MSKPKVSIILLMLMGFAFFQCQASSIKEFDFPVLSCTDSISIGDTSSLCDELFVIDTIARTTTSEKVLRKKKFVCSGLALPFPFGFVGAHRVMLGCKPWVPIVYIATLGGCFGILPLIDFCVLA